MIFIVILFALGGLLGSGILFRHSRMLTWLAVAGVVVEAQWILTTLVRRSWFSSLDISDVYTAAGLVFLLGWSCYWKRWSLPYQNEIGSGRRDLPILLILAVVLLATFTIVRMNGFMDHAWVTYGFYNGDTATFVALVQKSRLVTDSLVSVNPFSGNGPLEYPTLLHGAVADVLLVAELPGGMAPWLHGLPFLTYATIAMTIPLFFLLFDVFGNAGERKWPVLWLQLASVGYIVTLSWDNFVYPQSHFFLTGLFLFAVALWLRGNWIVAAVATLLLMMSNAVTGTAALLVLLAYCLYRREVTFGALALAALFIFFRFLPGEGALGIIPGFSYSAAGGFARLVPVLGLAIMGWYFLRSKKSSVLPALFLLGLIVLGLFVFVFSQRNIVIENSSRFLYHAAMVGVVFLPVALKKVLDWFIVLRSKRTSPEQRVLTWGFAGLLLVLAVMPSLEAIASTHSNLMRNDRQEISRAWRRALWDIEDNAPSNAVFVAPPEAPFAVPMFTGRSMLRADYWLSAQDDVQADVIAAYKGDSAAQERVMKQGDYLILEEDDYNLWDTKSLNSVFQTGLVSIFEL